MDVNQVAEPLHQVLHTLPEVPHQLCPRRLHECYQVHHLTAIIWLLEGLATEGLVLRTYSSIEGGKLDRNILNGVHISVR